MMYPKNILIVDDNNINRFLIKEILKKIDNFNFIESHNGKDAIDKLTNDIDLILMDIMMPVMGGVEATKYIRNNLKSNIPIIAITAHDDNDLNIENIFNKVILKPVNINILSDIVQNYL